MNNIPSSYEDMLNWGYHCNHESTYDILENKTSDKTNIPHLRNDQQSDRANHKTIPDYLELQEWSTDNVHSGI